MLRGFLFAQILLRLQGAPGYEVIQGVPGCGVIRQNVGYRTFGVVFIPDFGWCGGRNWGFELVCFNCEVGQDVLVEGRVLPVTAR